MSNSSRPSTDQSPAPAMEPGFSVSDKLNPINFPSNFSAQINNKDEIDNYIDYNAGVAAEDDEYFESFPPGYRFKPSDQELIIYYLMEKVHNRELPKNRIKDVQLYKYDPDTLAATYKPNGDAFEWYFFTPRERKYPQGTRPDRATEGGFWKATGKIKPVHFNGYVVGSKTTLVYCRGKPPKGKKTDWIMHEYKARDAPERRKLSKNDMKLDNWVLCKIKKNGRVNKAASPAGSSSQVQPIEFYAENVPIVPIMSGENHSGGDSDIIYYNNIGISEPMELSYHASSADAQHMMRVPAQNDLESWIDQGLELTSIPIDDTMLTSYDHIIYDPPAQELESIGFKTLNSLSNESGSTPGDDESKKW